MIRVQVRWTDEQVTSFSVSGHAGFADAGQDIVCSAVSVLVYNAVNSCERFFQAILDVVDTDAELACKVARTMVSDHDGVQMLLQSMVFGIRQIEAQYPRHVRVQDIGIPAKVTCLEEG